MSAFPSQHQRAQKVRRFVSIEGPSEHYADWKRKQSVRSAVRAFNTCYALRVASAACLHHLYVLASMLCIRAAELAHRDKPAARRAGHMPAYAQLQIMCGTLHWPASAGIATAGMLLPSR